MLIFAIIRTSYHPYYLFSTFLLSLPLGSRRADWVQSQLSISPSSTTFDYTSAQWATVPHCHGPYLNGLASRWRFWPTLVLSLILISHSWKRRELHNPRDGRAERSDSLGQFAPKWFHLVRNHGDVSSTHAYTYSTETGYDLFRGTSLNGDHIRARVHL